MKLIVQKQEILNKLSLASIFVSDKLSSSPILQGVYIKAEKNNLHFYASNLSSFFHTSLKAVVDKEITIVIEPKKLIEFINLLPAGKITIEATDKEVSVTYGKIRGSFPLLAASDFPLPPKIVSKGQKIPTEFLTKNLPLVLFAASSDEARPALTGVNFQTTDDNLIMVSTDGFRLSMVKTKKQIDIPASIIPASFLSEVMRFLKDEKESTFFYLEKEKTIVFSSGETEFFTRLIEGEFPPYEKVIPQDKATTVQVETEEFLRSVKLTSVFARDFSNIVVVSFKHDGLWCQPKMEKAEQDTAYCEATLKGEEQKVAFNFKYLLDFLNHSQGKKIAIEVLRPDAPVVLRSDDNPTFIHIIMPVRIQE